MTGSKRWAGGWSPDHLHPILLEARPKAHENYLLVNRMHGCMRAEGSELEGDVNEES